MPDVIAALLMQQRLVARSGLGSSLFDDAAPACESRADLTNMLQAIVLKSWDKVSTHRRDYN